MLNLIIKDFKTMLGSKQNLYQRVATAIFTLVFFCAFIIVELFLFRTILKQIGNINGAKESFLTVFLFVTTIILTISGLFNAKRLFFDNKDIEQLSYRPVSNTQIIVSKLAYLFFIHCLASLIFEYPLLVAYGQLANRAPIFFFKCIFYPVATFFFQMGIGLMLVYPVWLLIKFLKKHFLIELGFSLVIIFGLALCYSYVLDVFIKLVSKNGLVLLFSEEAIAKVISFRRFAVPVNFLLDIFVNNSKLSFLPFFAVSLGIFGMGLSVAIYAYNYVRNISLTPAKTHKKRTYKPVSVKKALIKKELALITKNSNYIFSFTGLLIVQPLLLTFVIRSMNASLTAGTLQYFTALIPGLTSYVDLLFIMLFTVIINQGANNYITMEKRTIKQMKTMPVKFSTQLFIKVSIPFIMSMISLLVSVIALMASKTVPFTTGLFGFIISACLLFIFDVVSLWEELSIRHLRARSTTFSSLISYLLPFVFAVSAIILSYLKVPNVLTILGGLLMIVLVGIAPVIVIFKNSGKLFLDLEAIN